MSDEDRIELMMRFRRDLAALLERPEAALPYSDAWRFLETPSGAPSTRKAHPRVRYRP